MNMRLLGARTIDDLVPEMVDASALNQHIVSVPTDHLFEQTCEFLSYIAGGIFTEIIYRPTAADHQAQAVSEQCSRGGHWDNHRSARLAHPFLLYIIHHVFLCYCTITMSRYSTTRVSLHPIRERVHDS